MSAPRSAEPTWAIEVRSLRKRFGSVQALDGVDLAVPPGSVLGLLGPNGAGKTTTVRVLTTTVAPDSGTATVLGVDVAAAPRRVRGLIGLAGQHATVDERLTGRENLVLLGQLTHQPRAGLRARADELLELFDLTAAADRPLAALSGGMRRRVDLAASLVHHPPVLFLDEPTTGLDPRSRLDLWALVRDLVRDGTTVLLTTQYLEEVDQMADQVAVIDRGRVIAEGTVAQLKASMGATVVEVAFAHRASARAGRDVLAGVLTSAEIEDTTVSGPRGATGGVGPRSESAPAVVRGAVADGARGALEVVRALDAAGLEPAGLTVREPTLDDVFLALTGQRAGEASPAR